MRQSCFINPHLEQSMICKFEGRELHTDSECFWTLAKNFLLPGQSHALRLAIKQSSLGFNCNVAQPKCWAEHKLPNHQGHDRYGPLLHHAIPLPLLELSLFSRVAQDLQGQAWSWKPRNLGLWCKLNTFRWKRKRWFSTWCKLPSASLKKLMLHIKKDRSIL